MKLQREPGRRRRGRRSHKSRAPAPEREVVLGRRRAAGVGIGGKPKREAAPSVQSLPEGRPAALRTGCNLPPAVPPQTRDSQCETSHQEHPPRRAFCAPIPRFRDGPKGRPFGAGFGSAQPAAVIRSFGIPSSPLLTFSLAYFCPLRPSCAERSRNTQPRPSARPNNPNPASQPPLEPPPVLGVGVGVG